MDTKPRRSDRLIADQGWWSASTSPRTGGSRPSRRPPATSWGPSHSTASPSRLESTGAHLMVGTQDGSLYALTAAEAGASDPSPTGGVASSATAERPSSSAHIITSTVALVEVWACTARDLGIEGPFFLNGAPDGRLWIADPTRARFVIVGRDGGVVETWQPTGDAALALVQPDRDGWGAVAFLPDGGFFIADSEHQRVVHFDTDREMIGSWGTFGSGPGQFVSPFGISVGPDGLVYVVDDPTCLRSRFSNNQATTFGHWREARTSADRCTNNVVVGPDGTVYFASGGRGAPWRITVIAPDGTIVRQIGEGLLREPVLLASGPNGELYATDGPDRLNLFATHWRPHLIVVRTRPRAGCDRAQWRRIHDRRRWSHPALHARRPRTSALKRSVSRLLDRGLPHRA